MKIERFEDLEIWKEARELSRKVFEITSGGPFSSDFKITYLKNSDFKGFIPLEPQTRKRSLKNPRHNCI